MQPQTISDVELVFPTTVGKLMPAYSDIPDEFKSDGNPYVALANKWFYNRLESNEIMVRDGIDEAQALRHLSYIMRSFEPKYEHKIAAVAYLLSQWFTPC